ncbi:MULTISPECIES: NtaA/DmoA family FMN-dependent monooxygenase [Frankia]|uniref:Nitrilotriacetate monooxygenase (Component A) n=1 Tax=Frankia alni (strain DSM 45986 / CECT 9034 / ACN14a) TaxID=326424 RepID=Q0RET7_FRAAA|nr:MULTISPECIES: NtaA/DmoA family FMN-dependent monooxygenase [Frankia]CAJ64019.1 putative nitrilotriacetate monooxygenase (Component A) [Frankia alni ACN14a]
MTRQVRLCLNLQATGRHDAAWKTLPPTSDWIAGIDYYTEIARLAERARFDAIFIADRLGSLDAASYRRPWRGTDPTVLLAALARETEHIGLVSTNPAIHGNPFLLARSIATLDHVSKGRAGWNIITSQEDVTRSALGVDEVLEPQARYRKAEEFISAVDALWASLPEDAVVADAAADVYIDARRTRPVDFSGEFYRTSGVLPLPGGYQGRRPVLFQAGASRQSKELGARWADALFTSQRLPELSREFSAEVKGLAAANGRNPDDLLVLPGLFTVLGATEAAARERKRELDELLAVGPLVELLTAQLEFDVSRLDLDAQLPYAELAQRAAAPAVTARRDQLVAEARRRGLTIRQLLFHNLSGGQRLIVGTPEQVADDIVEWVDTRASDGFVINIDVQPAGFVEFIEGVVTQLQDRGRFRREYAHDTLRGNLGIGGAPAGGRASAAGESSGPVHDGERR